MNTRIALAALLLSTSVGASDWQLFSDGEEVREFIDVESIRVDGNWRTVWSKQIYRDIQKNAAGEDYRVLSTRLRFNCKDLEYALIAMTFRNDGKIVTSHNRVAAEQEVEAVEPDTIAEAALEFVCTWKVEGVKVDR